MIVRRAAGWLRSWGVWVGLVAVVVCGVVGLAAPAGASAVGELTFDGCFGSAPGCVGVSGNPLQNAKRVAVSPNGGSVYVIGNVSGLPFPGFVSHFFVGAGGRLAYDGCVSNDGSGGACASIQASGGSGTPLEDPSDVAVSPNSRSVYVTSSIGQDLAHFKADPSQGQLRWERCLSNDGSGGACVSRPANGTGDPFSQLLGVAVSPNASAPNSSVYFISGSGVISHAFADPMDGQLNYDGCDSDGGSGGSCFTLPAVDPLNEVDAVAVNPTGTAVYATTVTGTISQFATSPPDGGGITRFVGCLNNDGLGCQGAVPLGDAEGLAVSPDGASVYAASAGSGSVSHFFADPAGKGLLSFDGCVSDDGTGGVCTKGPQTGTPLMGAEAVAVSPDGRSVYVVSASQDSLSWFTVAPQGQLTFQGCLSDNAIPGCGNPSGKPLEGADSVVVSPDGGSVYVASETGGTVAHFIRAQPATGGGSGGSGSGGSGGSAGGSSPISTITATVGNQRISLSTPAQSGCLATSGRLSAKLTSAAIAGSTSTALRFTSAVLRIDRGIRHVHHRTVLRHGKRVRVTTITYTANRTVRSLPATVSLSLTGLRTGSHTLKVTVSYNKTVRRNGRRHTVSVSKTLTAAFRVC
jgi:DNA-binding beta-propeller fold protein YncE